MQTKPSNKLSLKARAINLLSRREHSLSELRRKLGPHSEDAAELDSLLEELQKGNWISQERFAESLVHRRAARHGTRRILQELRQHDLPDETLAELTDKLKSTEFQRAHAVWSKRFTSPPADAKDYAKQMRYMAARGFTADSLRQVLVKERSRFTDDVPSFDDVD